jgi:predicted ATPase
MERAAAFTLGDTPQVKLDKLDALLAQTSTAAKDASLFADMISLPNDGRYPSLDLTSEQRRQRTLEALGSQVDTLSRSTPVLMIFEDAHWTDPTSLEAFSKIVDRLRTLRVLLIVTFRPEFAPPWIGRPYVTALTLNRLAQRDIEAMIDGVIGNKPLPANLRLDIIERTDGIPLFVEEITKAVLEGASEGAAQRTVASIPSPTLGVPASLQASLMARLDRLGSAKEIAQIGAAIGREFSHALLSAVVSKPQPELVSALDRLTQSGLLFRQGVTPHATYLFKHALVQDAAYGTLLREPRRALHARIADTLESLFPDIAESQPDLLARHCTEAGLIEKAASLWGKAGQRSLDRSALAEAVEQVTRGLELIATLPPTAALRREQIKLQVALIAPLFHLKGYSAVEPTKVVERAHLLIQQAEALGEPPEDRLQLFVVLHGFWAANLVAFNADVVCQLATQFLALAKQQGSTAPLLVAHRIMGPSLLCTGDTRGAREHLDEALALYDPAEHRPLATRFGEDQSVAVLCWRAHALWALGYPESALVDADCALRDARLIGQAATLMFALAFTAMIHIQCGNYVKASALAHELITVAGDKGAAQWRALAIVEKGCVLSLTGKIPDGVHTITVGIAATAAALWRPTFLSSLASACADLGRFDEAWRFINEAAAMIETNKERRWEAQVNLVAGEIALKSPTLDATKAEAHFERALTVACEQQAKSWELRAAMSLARLWRDQGRRDAARELLAPVYGWFTEGFDTRDLKEAKALLEELA